MFSHPKAKVNLTVICKVMALEEYSNKTFLNSILHQNSAKHHTRSIQVNNQAWWSYFLAPLNTWRSLVRKEVMSIQESQTTPQLIRRLLNQKDIDTKFNPKVQKVIKLVNMKTSYLFQIVRISVIVKNLAQCLCLKLEDLVLSWIKEKAILGKHPLLCCHMLMWFKPIGLDKD